MVNGSCVRTIHAEQNAINQCAKYGVNTEGATAYVTHQPCLNCTKSLIQAGIKRIVYTHPYRHDPNVDAITEGVDIVIEEKCHFIDCSRKDD